MVVKQYLVFTWRIRMISIERMVKHRESHMGVTALKRGSLTQCCVPETRILFIYLIYLLFILFIFLAQLSPSFVGFLVSSLLLLHVSVCCHFWPFSNYLYSTIQEIPYPFSSFFPLEIAGSSLIPMVICARLMLCARI